MIFKTPFVVVNLNEIEKNVIVLMSSYSRTLQVLFLW